MNFFGGGQEQQQGPDPVFAAKTEMEMYTDLFNKIADKCFGKCASRKHKDPDLSLGEMTCTDRCVAKYLESQQRVGEVLQQANEQQLAQQQSMVNTQKAMGN
jgi:import inner membrane translocase subunit TIM10